MKKIISVVMGALFVTSLCFAEQAPAPKKPKANEPMAGITLTGMVKSVTPEDAAKGVKPAIVVADNAGKQANCLVTPSTKISGKEGKPIQLSQLAAGEHVSVKYVMTKDGMKEALKIKLLA